ncbi:transmembrane carbonic anhydrase, SulP domain protein [Mycobacterium xenopi 3993]|nr:transmembrane carbonic anhydrase, SulP domain protein [Mycobacterium xenopi 3993]
MARAGDGRARSWPARLTGVLASIPRTAVTVDLQPTTSTMPHIRRSTTGSASIRPPVGRCASTELISRSRTSRGIGSHPDQRATLSVWFSMC